MSINLGKELTNKFFNSGMKQSYVAHMLHVSKSTMSSYVTGTRDVPEDVMTKLAALFDDYDLSETLANRQYGTLKGMNSSLYGERPSELHDVQEAEEQERQQELSGIELNRILASTKKPLSTVQQRELKQYLFELLDEIIAEIKYAATLATFFLHVSLLKLIKERQREWIKKGLMKG